MCGTHSYNYKGNGGIIRQGSIIHLYNFSLKKNTSLKQMIFSITLPIVSKILKHAKNTQSPPIPKSTHLVIFSAPS